MSYDDVQTVLTGHINEETAFVQDGYPYGRHRTQRRVWVETASKGSKKDQQRFMAQTCNPKTGKWNKPKGSTYSHILVIYLDSKDHVQLAALSTWDNAERIAAFVEQFGEFLTDEQRDSIKYLDAVQRVSSRIKWTISTDNTETTEQREQRKQEENRMLNAMLRQELRTPSSEPVLK